MTTPETPPSSPEPKQVVGVDPPEPIVAPPVAEPVAPLAPPTTPSVDEVTLSQEEYTAMQDKAGNYDTMVNDPQLQSVIYGHLRDRASGVVPTDVTDPSAVPNAPVAPGGNPMEARMARMEGFLQNAAQAFQQQNDTISSQAKDLQSLRNDEFSRSNPTYREHEVAISKVRTANPNLSLNDALTLIEARAFKAGNGTVAGGNPATPTTEGGGAGGMPSSNPSGDIDEARLADLAALIDDPKATPSMDSALDAIGNAFGVNG